MATQREPSLERLKNGRRIAAELVKHHGEDFLPFFKRLHKEVQAREAVQKDIDLALEFCDD